MVRLRNLIDGYKRFVSGFGFMIVLVVCIGVITATAVWTKKQEKPYQPSARIPGDDIDAASALQENLSSAIQVKSTQQQTISNWVQPLSKWNIVLPYSPDVLVNARMSRLWQLHDGVDLLAEPGEAVASIGKGVVVECGSDALHGSWVRVDYGQGITALYSSLSMLAAIQSSDRVNMGETIGFADGGSEPFIHLSIYQNNQPIDPALLLKSDHFQSNLGLQIP